MKTARYVAAAAVLLIGSTRIPAFAQTAQKSKPLLIVKVDREKVTLTSADGIYEPTATEVSDVRLALVRELSSIFQIIPETDKRDCIELGVIIEKMRLGNRNFFVGSSAVALGKGDSDLLMTHNPIVQPTAEKVADSIAFQLSVIVLQSQLGGLTSK